jgi:hypothetical protein
MAVTRAGPTWFGRDNEGWHPLNVPRRTAVAFIALATVLR